MVKLEADGAVPAARYIACCRCRKIRGSEVEALSGALLELAAKAIALAQPQSATELTRMLAGNEDPLRLAYLLASIFSLDLAQGTEAARSRDARRRAAADALLSGA